MLSKIINRFQNGLLYTKLTITYYSTVINKIYQFLRSYFVDYLTIVELYICHTAKLEIRNWKFTKFSNNLSNSAVNYDQKTSNF